MRQLPVVAEAHGLDAVGMIEDELLIFGRAGRGLAVRVQRSRTAIEMALISFWPNTARIPD